MKLKNYTLKKGTTITSSILKSYVQLFWNDVFKPLHNVTKNIHLLIMCKVEYVDSTLGHRSLANLRKVNYSDINIFSEYLSDRLGLLADSYQITPFSKISFTYIVKDGIAEESQQLLKIPLYPVKAQAFNNRVLPLSMVPSDYGKVIAINEICNNRTKYVVENANKNHFFSIEVTTNKDNLIVNDVRLLGPADLTWTDTKISDDTFKRVIGHNTIYISKGEVIVKSKQLPAKPFRKILCDKEIADTQSIMTMDIETVKLDNTMYPYLLCAYSEGNSIQSYAKDITKESIAKMFNRFIEQIIADKNVRYVYAHFLSGFDGIFLLKHLINFPGLEVEPLVFNGKLISISIKFRDSKKNRTITFKDSYLMLPICLRLLCVAFNVDTIKSYFPFGMSDINYIGELPAFKYWTDTSPEAYASLRDSHGLNSSWSFKEESIKYCMLDCKSLFEVLAEFNKLVFMEFNVNILSSLTLPSLAMRIYKALYMPKNSIYQILGQVERDIR